MAAVGGEAIPNIITINYLKFFGQFGGTGCTFALIITTYLVGKNKASKVVCGISVLPGLFNTNEPMIFLVIPLSTTCRCLFHSFLSRSPISLFTAIASC